jgi:hypothetical protein
MKVVPSLVGRVFMVRLLSGADVTRGTLPILAPAKGGGKLHLVVVAVQGALGQDDVAESWRRARGGQTRSTTPSRARGN